MGCPVGLDFTVTLGVVSAPKRSAFEVGAMHLKGSYIQTDAALNSGNSGGPLVNDAGEVIGINSMVRSHSEAIGFAIPINRAKAIYEILRQGVRPTHAYFGLELSSITPDQARIHNEDPNASPWPILHGAVVMKVAPNSPAEAAGLRRHDVLVSIDEHVVQNAEVAEGLLDSCKPDHSSKFKVVRGEASVELELEARPLDLYVLMETKRKMQAAVLMGLKPQG